MREECGEFTDVDFYPKFYWKLKLNLEGVISEKVVQFFIGGRSNKGQPVSSLWKSF